MIQLNQTHQWLHMLHMLPGIDWAMRADTAEGPVEATTAGSQPTAATRHWKSPDPTWPVGRWFMASPQGITRPSPELAKWQLTCQEEGGVQVQAQEQQQRPEKRRFSPHWVGSLWLGAFRSQHPVWLVTVQVQSCVRIQNTSGLFVGYSSKGSTQWVVQHRKWLCRSIGCQFVQA